MASATSHRNYPSNVAFHMYQIILFDDWDMNVSNLPWIINVAAALAVDYDTTGPLCTVLHMILVFILITAFSLDTLITFSACCHVYIELDTCKIKTW